MATTRAWCARRGWLAGFAWGLAESTVFFLVPDVGVAFIAIMAPRQWWIAAVASIAGTLVGAVLVFFAVHLWLHDAARQALLAIPAIHPRTLTQADARIAAHGPAALLLAAYQGIPYKVYATELTIGGLSLPALLLWTLPSRALRMIPVAAAAGLGGAVLSGSITRHFKAWVAAYVIFWAIFYGWYWTR